MRRKCLKCLIRQLIPLPPLQCNFVQVTNKMKTTLAKPHPIVGMENPPRKKVIPKDHGKSIKREIASPFKLLAMKWMIILEDQCKKGKSPCSRVVDFLPFFIRQARDVKQALLRRQSNLCYDFSLNKHLCFVLVHFPFLCIFHF